MWDNRLILLCAFALGGLLLSSMLLAENKRLRLELNPCPCQDKKATYLQEAYDIPYSELHAEEPDDVA